MLVLLNGQDTDKADVSFERVMVVFEDGDGMARAQARTQFKRAKDAGLSVRYFKQTSSGGWAEQGG